ncbi:hypothetical protein AB0I49_33640 [Streptomyces sp. NPDC050617]|uniref:hypothetical protein n=1 Tax=Streptomyces sp. NPDC050617 TaxID=3154628 RepID=UPI0034253746
MPWPGGPAVEKIIVMTNSFRVDRILGDRPFAEIGEPALAVEDERRGLLAVAGTRGPVADVQEFGISTPVGVYGTGDLACRALLRTGYRVHALAFHPELPLLAVGTGDYDGGYFFEGQLLLLDWETGGVTSLIEPGLGRQVLGLEWLSAQELRVLMAPPDDWHDKDAWNEGHVAVVRRPDWRAVPPQSVTAHDLAGPRVAAPRTESREDARRMVSGLSTDWDPRRNVRAVEELPDGRIVATLDGFQLESWLPSGRRQWAVRDDGAGGRDIVVAADGRSVWVALARPSWEERAQAVLRLALQDGAQLGHITPSSPTSLVRCADGLPALAPVGQHEGRNRLRIRRGSRIYFREITRETRKTRDKGRREPGAREVWLVAAELGSVPVAERPREPKKEEAHRLFPYSWKPGETHFAGPGAETADGDLIHAGTVHHGRGLQPGGSFVVRRMVADAEPKWVFRTDHKATDLDCDTETAYVTYKDGEVVALALHDGSVRWRRHLTVAGVPVMPTALTVPEPGRLLIGTADGRLLDCSTD